MSLQPHFYLGPIEVSFDENEMLAVVWHTQALHRETQLSGNFGMIAGQTDIPAGLMSDRFSSVRDESFMPTLFIDKLSSPMPVTIDSRYGDPQAAMQNEFVQAFQSSLRVVSVAECLHLSF